MKKQFLAIFSIILPILVIGSMILLPKSQLQDTSSESFGSLNLHDYTIVHIGEGNNVSTQVVDEIRDLGAQVTISNKLLKSMELNDSLIAIFDTEWIKQEINDTKLHDFLRIAASREVKLVAVGETTSEFFEALDRAGVHELALTETGTVRNPAYFNPPLVGYRIKKADGYVYPKLLFSNTNNVNELVQALINWLW